MVCKTLSLKRLSAVLAFGETGSGVLLTLLVDQIRMIDSYKIAVWVITDQRSRGRSKLYLLTPRLLIFLLVILPLFFFIYIIDKRLDRALPS